MCIGSNSVNQAQDLISVTKFEDFPNSLLPSEDKEHKNCFSIKHDMIITDLGL